MRFSSLEANGSQFYFDYQDGKYGFNTDPNRGADTFSPFKSSSEIQLIKSGLTGSGTLDIKQYRDDWASLTKSNFLLVLTNMQYSDSKGSAESYPSLSYNNSTGKLSYVCGAMGWYTGQHAWNTCSIYVK